MIVVFTGGTGGTKLVQGLQQVVRPGELTVVVNTGDDLEWWGLHVSPDVDSVLYGLASVLSRERGWGVEGDSFRCLERMKQLEQPSWFSLGDLDLATHLARTAMLRAGKTLSQATAELAAKFGAGARVLPMSDGRVSTVLDTARGRLSFQEYFVRERHQVEVHAVRFEGAGRACPAPGVLAAIAAAEAIILAPSNPVTSIGPILAVPGIRNALRQTAAPVLAVSPIVGADAVSGPAGALMRMMGWPSTVAGVAKAYEDFLDVLVVDGADEAAAAPMRDRGLRVLCTNILMNSMDDKRALAAFVLESCAPARSAGA
ncbi:MAG TPA: 2-phospho-L-lactate transferase [Candidatus Binatia bacterium]|nr:2-phospho-L-lactate transferase [Candidatus Binatia bacterium]